MKPRTRLQLETWQLHKSLPKPKEHEAFVISKHEFYYTTHYKNLVCLECNHSWRPPQTWHAQVVGVKCPSCEKNLIKSNNYNGLLEKVISYSVVQVVGRFQVFRYFSCWKFMYKNKPPHYSFRSLFEEWVDYDKNKKVVIGRNPSDYGDGFSYSDYEVRYNKNPWGGMTPFDRFISTFNCPDAEFLPRFKKYGLGKDFHNCDYRYLLNALERSTKIETLFKAKQKELLYHGVHVDSKYDQYWPQIKIVLRHKYKIKDASMWYDLLDLLRYFNKDLHSPKFICPKSLKREHDYWMNKKRKIQEAQAREREKKEAIKRQENLKIAMQKFEEHFGKFFELELTKGNITIKALRSIDEFKEEGDELKHCLYTNEYYLKKDSLILSARVDGVRTETVEFSLKNMKVSQARGLKNNTTPFHDEILGIIKANISKIKKLAQQPSEIKTESITKNQHAA